jgi:hypothetical protein
MMRATIADTMDRIEARGFCSNPFGGNLVSARGAETTGFLPSASHGLVCCLAMRATGAQTRSGTGGKDSATPRREMAKIASPSRKAVGSSLVRTGKVC